MAAHRRAWRNISTSIFLFIAVIAGCLFAEEIGAPAPAKIHKSGNISICFSPNGNCVNEILELIQSSKKTIDAAIFSFTSLELSRALVEAKNRGVKIRVISDNAQADDKYSKYQYLKDSGIPARIDGSKGSMHDKFAVIDNKILITGSYNWSQSAETRNFENVVVIEDEKIAKIFADEFERIWEECR